MLLFVIVMGVLGSLFTIRECWWLYALGIWLYMCIIPVIEASEQTVIQKVVPYETQGRVFGFAQAFEAAAAPVTAFLIAPIAQFWIIPYMDSDAGQQTWGWLLGEGEARGIALVFFFAGLVMVVLALLAFTTRAYRTLSAEYETGEPVARRADDGARDRRRPTRAAERQSVPRIPAVDSITGRIFFSRASKNIDSGNSSSITASVYPLGRPASTSSGRPRAHAEAGFGVSVPRTSS